MDRRTGLTRPDAPFPADGRPAIEYVNFAAFVARLDARGIWRRRIQQGISELRVAFECNLNSYQAQDIDVLVLAAAQQIFWNGSNIFALVRDPPTTDEWFGLGGGGPRWKGESMDLRGRWKWWKNGFRAATYQNEDDRKALRQEGTEEKEPRDLTLIPLRCELAIKAVVAMDALEAMMTF